METPSQTLVCEIAQFAVNGMNDPVLYRIQIDFAKAMSSYEGHVKRRCRLEYASKLRIWLELLLQGISATALVSLFVSNTMIAKAIATCFTTLSLVLSIQNHRVRPTELLREAFRIEELKWAFKEQYASLLLDYVGARIGQDEARARANEILVKRGTVASGQMLTEREFDRAMHRLLRKRPVWLSVFEWEMLRAPFIDYVPTAVEDATPANGHRNCSVETCEEVSCTEHSRE